MTKLIAITLVVGLFLVGCAIPNVSPTEDILPPSIPPEPKVEQPIKEQPPIVEVPCADCPGEPVDKQEAYTLKATPAKPKETKVVLPGQPPDDMTWISPGKVQVGNFYPGARAEWPLIIHNGNDTETSFSIKYRYPDHVGEEYVKPTSVVQDWIIIADSTPVIASREAREILIVLMMPKELRDSQVTFWQITSTGELILSEVRKKLYAEFEKEALEQKDSKVRDKLLAQIPQRVKEAMLADPTTNLLLYLQYKGSVSLEDFSEQRSKDSILVVDLNKLGHASMGDLRKDKWEFWISVIDKSQTGMVQTELCTRWLINMRTEG